MSTVTTPQTMCDHYKQLNFTYCLACHYYIFGCQCLNSEAIAAAELKEGTFAGRFLNRSPVSSLLLSDSHCSKEHPAESAALLDA